MITYVKRSGAIAMHYFMLFYAVTRSSFQSLSEKSWFILEKLQMKLLGHLEAYPLSSLASQLLFRGAVSEKREKRKERGGSKKERRSAASIAGMAMAMAMATLCWW
jgi:hypothetical protein